MQRIYREILAILRNFSAIICSKADNYCSLLRNARIIRNELASQHCLHPQILRIAEQTFQNSSVAWPQTAEDDALQTSSAADGFNVEDCLLLARAELQSAAALLARDAKNTLRNDGKTAARLSGLLSAQAHTATALRTLQHLPTAHRC